MTLVCYWPGGNAVEVWDIRENVTFVERDDDEVFWFAYRLTPKKHGRIVLGEL